MMKFVPTIASSQDDSQVRASRAMSQIEYELRELLANLLRVHRGAGKPHNLAPQICQLSNMLFDYYSEFEHAPSAVEMASAIKMDKERGLSPTDDEFQYSLEQMLSGAAQMMASRLVGQLTQERSGQDEMLRGVKALESVREKNRRNGF